MIQKKKKKKEGKKKLQELSPPSPLHTWRLKSQHDKIITTFPNSTPRYGFALWGGVHFPSSSPTLRLISLGFLLPRLMDIVFV